MLGLPGLAVAQEIDGKQPLVCSLSEVSECDPSASCEDATPAAVELPPDIHIDFETNTLVTRDGTRTSPIETVRVLDEVVLLQGVQGSRGWLVVLEKSTGHLSATVLDHGGAFVLAGGCTVATQR
jgi:hypothetical protein